MVAARVTFLLPGSDEAGGGKYITSDKVSIPN